MGYTIEYVRQFLVSKAGYTPAWMAGSNNCTQIDWATRREIRERSWSIWGNFLGVTEADLVAFAESCANEYDQHWMSNGKFLTNDGVVRWVKNGVKRAASIEEVLHANQMSSAHCYVSVWGKGLDDHSNELSKYISSTEELDGWIEKAKALIEKEKADGKSCYPVIEFRQRDFVKPIQNRAAKNPEKSWFLKSGKGYVSELSPTHMVVSKDPKKALRLDSQTAQYELENNRMLQGTHFSLVDADKPLQPYNAIIQDSDGCYLAQNGSRSIHLTHQQTYAKKYPNLAAAEKAAAKLNGRRFKGSHQFTAVLVE